MSIKDFPKLDTPLIRKMVNGNFICIPKFDRKFFWILDKNLVIPTEKFDGTNVSIVIENHTIKNIYNRKNIIDVWQNKEFYFEGIHRAIHTKKISLNEDGQFFGELIGPKININRHKIDYYIWLPFDYIKHRYVFRFYYEWLKELDKTKLDDDKYLYEQLSELLKSLKSIFRYTDGYLDEPEGIVFHNKATGEMCKLRKDMFDWFTGKRH